MRRRLVPLVATAGALACALAACGSSSHGGGHARAATSTSAATRPTSAAAQATSTAIVVHVTYPRTEPKAGGLWPITVVARTRAGAAVDGDVHYAFLLGSSVVARRPGGRMRGGVYHDRLEFPAEAVGYPITLEVIVEGDGGTGTATRPVRVQQ